jgi:hypothetical protein
MLMQMMLMLMLMLMLTLLMLWCRGTRRPDGLFSFSAVIQPHTCPSGVALPQRGAGSGEPLHLRQQWL